MNLFAHPAKDAVLRLLSGAGLPTADLTTERLSTFFGCGARPDSPDGVVGIEIYGDVALLRSLAVATSHRGNGLGTALVQHTEQEARRRGVRSIYLLTETAEQFFAERGYVRIPRAQAPPSIRTTREFSELCPASSAFMVRHLTEAPVGQSTA